MKLKTVSFILIIHNAIIPDNKAIIVKIRVKAGIKNVNIIFPISC